MKAEYLRDMTGPVTKEHPTTKRPKGSIMEHPDAYKLVQLGVAKPADEECAAKCGMTPEQIEKALWFYNRTDAGILPEEFDAYEKGYLIGYNNDGSWIPGPNYTEYEREQLDEQIENSDIIT